MTPPRPPPSGEPSAARLRRLADEAGDELERRLRAGEPCRAEDLLARHPELAEDPPLALDLIGLEFVLRRQRGEAPTVDEVCARFPQWREPLELLLTALSATPTRSSTGQWTLPDPRPAAEPRGAPLRRLGQYELLERIGHGGMGDVYRARQSPPLERVVALKLLRTGDEFEVRTFEKEIEVARRLRHPNLLPIYDAGCVGGEYFYTMPLLPGGSLERRLRRGRPQPRWAAALVEKVARALDHAHRQGVLHRDLKPANILLDDHDEPLVADFGLAKLLDQSLGQTQSGQLLGSVPYMSPEQAAGQGHRATPASDVWSLGVILYELLTGGRPFQGRSHSEILGRISRQEPFRPRQVQADVPPELEAVCLRCLEKEPAWRYASAGELADDLRRWLDGLPPAQPPDSLTALLRRRLPRGRSRWLGVGLLLSALALAAGLLLRPSPRPADPPAVTRSPQDELLADEAQAAPGRPLIVLAPDRPPRWMQSVTDEDAAKVVHKPGKPLSIDTLSVCLIEVLPPNPRRRAFRLTVQVRHTDLRKAGGVGVYVGRSRHVADGTVGHSFIKAEYAEPHLFRDAGELLPPVPLEKLCKADLGVCYLRLPGGQAPQPQRWTLASAALVPGNLPDGGSLWRTLTLEMSEQAIRLRGDAGKECAIRRPDGLRPVVAMLRRRAELREVAPEFPPSGGIGIFVFGGSADVRAIRLEPLQENP